MAVPGHAVCWYCRSWTPANEPTCISCGHPLAAAPPSAPPALGPAGPLPPQPFPPTSTSPAALAATHYGARILASFLDASLVGALWIPVVGAFPLWLGAPLYTWAPPLGSLLNIFLPLTLMFAYKLSFESTSGRTLGKRAARLRTVREDLGPVSFDAALKRSLAVYLWPTVAFPLLDLWLVKGTGQTLADRWARTYVIPLR